jgi:type 1 glutamine amidotransferase
MQNLLFIAFLIAASLEAQVPKKKILAIGEVKGFQHDSVSHALATIEKLGKETGLWDTYIRTDSQLLTKKKLEGNAKNLDFFDAVLFYTTGELDMDAQQKADLLSFIKDDGKGFIGIHSATDTFYQWPEYGEMIGGYFDQHPWNTFNAPVIVEDRDFPGMQQFPSDFVILDEIYQYKNYSRDNVRVLMRLDESKLDLTNPRVHRTDNDFAVGWVKNYGKGRVYYSNLGHREETYDRPDIQKMFIEGIKWSLGLTQADATPRPKP